MSHKKNSNQNFKINILRKNKPIFNINPNKDKRDVSYNNSKEKKNENKTKGKVIYKRRNNPKNNLLFGDKILKDLKSSNIRKKSDNNKSETSRNTNKPNHSFYESHYSNGINKKLDKIDLKITIFKKEITKEILKSQTEMKDALLKALGSISNSMKQLIDGQNELIRLSTKK